MTLLDTLVTDLAGSFDRATLKAELARTLEVFGQSESDDLLAGYLRDRLRAIGAGRSLAGVAVPTVLFVCVHNAGRSQMAASRPRCFAPAARGRSTWSPRAAAPPTG